MAYTINLTNGTILTTIADGTVNTTSSSLTLIGKNYSGYGTFLNDNLIHILENSANSTEPTVALTGQLWWDTAGNLKVYSGSGWKTLSSITTSNSTPTSAVTGNQWWDSTNQQLNVYNGTSWTLVGPAFTSNTGTSGTIVGTIIDSNAASHVAVNVYVSNTLVGVYSKDSAYTPATSISGFTTIKPGFNLVGTGAVSGVALWGTASDASGLGNIAASNYARTDSGAGSTTFNVPVFVNTNSGLQVGTANAFAVSVSSSTVQIDNQVNNADLAIRANIGGTVANVIAITGTNGNVAVNGNINLSTKNLVTTGNIYASYFNGIAISSYYADIAERFASDQTYSPGTVVELGGLEEITMATDDLSENVFGVISTNPAHLMNGAAGSNETHPPVALSGRVPVKVIGKIKKGDRLVSAGNGLARSGAKNEITQFNVIGRSLETKNTDDEGVILAIVKLNS